MTTGPMELIQARATEVTERAVFAKAEGHDLLYELCVDELRALLAIAKDVVHDEETRAVETWWQRRERRWAES
jgi:hypothetical protein